MVALRQKVTLLVLLILILISILTGFAERGNHVSLQAPSAYASASMSYHPMHACPPPPFDC